MERLRLLLVASPVSVHVVNAMSIVIEPYRLPTFVRSDLQQYGVSLERPTAHFHNHPHIWVREQHFPPVVRL
jgi:hypothetical protein